MSDLKSPLPSQRQPAADAPRVIDMHAHCGAPEADAMLAGHPQRDVEMATLVRDSGPASMKHNAEVMLPAAGKRMASLDQRLLDLDAMGVDMQIVSPSPTLYGYWADRALATDVIAASNAAAVALVARAPDRLAGLGIVAMQHPELAAEQVAAAKAAGLRGIEISTSVQDRELSDPAFDPVWHAAEAQGMPVFLHPFGSSLGPRLTLAYLSNAVGQPAETTVALSHMIFSGVFDRFPKLKVVGAHGGGYLPAYIGRSDHTWTVRPEARGCKRLPSEYLGNIWVDTVVFDRRQLADLVARMGADHVMFGTDYPYDMSDCQPAEVAAALPKDARTAVMAGTAAALFGV